MFGSRFTREVRSGSIEFPERQDVYEKLLTQLLSTRSDGWAHFRCPARKKFFGLEPFIEVALDGKEFLVNFGSFSSRQRAALRTSGYPFPAGWKFEDKDSLLRIPVLERMSMIHLIEHAFVHVIGVQAADVIYGYLDGL